MLHCGLLPGTPINMQRSTQFDHDQCLLMHNFNLLNDTIHSSIHAWMNLFKHLANTFQVSTLSSPGFMSQGYRDDKNSSYPLYKETDHQNVTLIWNDSWGNWSGERSQWRSRVRLLQQVPLWCWFYWTLCFPWERK